LHSTLNQDLSSDFFSDVVDFSLNKKYQK
jgi:hypothetical protein